MLVLFCTVLNGNAVDTSIQVHVHHTTKIHLIQLAINSKCHLRVSFRHSFRVYIAFIWTRDILMNEIF